ncbi:VOC family protein [Halocatena marina]|uniref:VOC family protein n=1 Tax=Halocatena marina TaxID=2934937 RepID=A0ABD5YTG3_9EURY|nr:VOC family protein [Halocatena marina]
MIDWKQIDHVQLCIPVGTEPEAREFYETLLGFEEISKPEALRSNGGLWFRANSIELHLGIEKNDSRRSKRHPAFEVSNLDATRAHLEENGVEITDETPIPGRERFSFRDPFEHRIEIVELQA